MAAPFNERRAEQAFVARGVRGESGFNPLQALIGAPPCTGCVTGGEARAKAPLRRSTSYCVATCVKLPATCRTVVSTLARL